MAVNLSFIGGAGWQFFDNNGVPLSGGKLYTYAAGTTTPLVTYTSRTGATPNTNPIVLDSAGRTPAQVWATEGLLYKYVLTTSTDTVLATYDNIGGSVVASDLAQDLAASSGSSLVGFLQSGTGAVARTVQLKLREIISVKDFGAVGDGVTDDTATIQAAINYCRDNRKRLVGATGDNYRITSGLTTQYDGFYDVNDIDFSMCRITADFSGSVAFDIIGGSARQKVKLNLVTSFAHTFNGTYDSASIGVRVLNTRTDLDVTVSGFKGDNVLLGSDALNSNTSNYSIVATSGGRGVLITGSNDNISVCTSYIRAYGNGLEGIRVSDTSAMRQWTGTWYAENNWTTNPNNSANYGVYIGKATGCDLWIYSEQTGTASEIYAHPTNVTLTKIFSARANKDTLTGNVTAWGGKIVYQNDYNGASGANYRKAEPLIFQSKMARVANADEYVRIPLLAGNGTYGYLRGEGSGVFLDSPSSAKSVGVNDSYVSLGTISTRIHSGYSYLTSTTTSETIAITTLSAFRSITGRIYVSGKSGAGTGNRHYVADFYISGTTLTINTPVINVSPSTPPTVTLSVSGSTLQLYLDYSVAGWGASYTFAYTVEMNYA